MKNNKAAFTLVELSIALIIVGLVAIAIIGGGVLIDVAKNRKLISEITKYKTAIIAFYDKYHALPGDFNDATNIWGNSDMANGDGDLKIEDVGATVGVYEHALANHHLAKAEFIDDQAIDYNNSGGAYQFDSYDNAYIKPIHKLKNDATSHTGLYLSLIHI